ncbi:hypothetical protein BDQ17DRAFT_1259020 [Cyathus striatus]|nr:hypothetical protein BDQ17DRAFT_1259020 [Cyathus striatus]
MESGVDDGDIAPEREEEDEMYDPDHPDESNSEVKRRKAKAKSKKAKSLKKRKHDDDDDENVKSRRVVVGELVQAPKTGRVPPGQISKNTIDFLTCLKDPKCNDRVWFKLHGTFLHFYLHRYLYYVLEPVFRQAEREFKDFIEVFTNLLVEVDSEIPHLPPNDVIHRIYRDMRFSNDKTPYRHRFCASFSRTGRSFKKGYYAGFMPDSESLIAGGLWYPKKAELDILRTNLQRPNGARLLRQLISSPEFVKLFGPAKSHPKGKRQNVFGMEDELKSAPRGVSQGHKEINLLKLRSFVVIHTLTDTEVLSPNFKIRLMDITRVLQPFVHCLNELTTVGYVPLSSGADSEDEIEEDCGSEDEEDED